MKSTTSSPRISLKLSRIIALIGSVVTLVQAGLLWYEREGICFNDGCAVVESLTTVDPIFINLGGFVFFQLIFWSILLVGIKPQRLGVVRVFLLAGIAVEAVLVAFQYLIAQVFCSYCLIILGLVVSLNLLAGVRHIIAATIIFTAVVLSFAGLQFNGTGGRALERLDDGVYASLEGAEEEKRYLFISSNCNYCEEVVVSLQDGFDCGVMFNPIDEIKEFYLPNAQKRPFYDPSINKAFLQQLNLDQIPVLYVEREHGFSAITGAGPILDYLEAECRGHNRLEPTLQLNGVSEVPGLDFLQPQDEACSVNTDCDEDGEVPQLQY